MRSAVLLFIVGLLVTSCAKHPPALTPVGVAAFQRTEVQKNLDLLRDIAQAANAQTPPLISTATTRKVTTYHLSAIRIIHDSAAGWQAAVTTGLDEVLKDVPATERAVLAPYVTLIKAVLTEVTR
jgi:hypothetical protein